MWAILSRPKYVYDKLNDGVNGGFFVNGDGIPHLDYFINFLSLNVEAIIHDLLFYHNESSQGKDCNSHRRFNVVSFLQAPSVFSKIPINYTSCLARYDKYGVSLVGSNSNLHYQTPQR